MTKETLQKNSARKKMLTGTVVSDKMKDTIVVLVESYSKHPQFEKFVRSKKRFKVHDPGNTKKVGEKVMIEESAPISRHKHFKVK